MAEAVKQPGTVILGQSFSESYTCWVQTGFKYNDNYTEESQVIKCHYYCCGIKVWKAGYT